MKFTMLWVLSLYHCCYIYSSIWLFLLWINSPTILRNKLYKIYTLYNKLFYIAFCIRFISIIRFTVYIALHNHVEIKCGKPKTMPYSFLEYNETRYLSRALYSCEFGYESVSLSTGQVVAVCNELSLWKEVYLECIGIYGDLHFDVLILDIKRIYRPIHVIHVGKC